MAESKDIKGVPMGMAACVEYAEGAVVSRTLVNKPVGTITVFAFDADQSLSEHTAPYDAFVASLEGDGELIIGGKSVVPVPGEFVIMPANVPHSVHARGRFKMLLVMIRA